MAVFRVAEFEKKGGRQVFKGFKYSGYKLGQNGRLYHTAKKVNQKDKRCRNYVELNLSTFQKDISGKAIFENDVCRELKRDVLGVIKYYSDKGSFILEVTRGYIKIPYSILDTDDIQLKKITNIYRSKKNELEKIGKKI